MSDHDHMPEAKETIRVKGAAAPSPGKHHVDDDPRDLEFERGMSEVNSRVMKGEAITPAVQAWITYCMARAALRSFGVPEMPLSEPFPSKRRHGETAGLTFDQLRQANVERLQRFPGHRPEDGNEPWSTADWFVAVTGELGELGNMLKKIKRGTAYEGMAMPRAADLADELADIVTYLDLLAAHLGIDLAEAIISKFNRVSARWKLPNKL